MSEDKKIINNLSIGDALLSSREHVRASEDDHRMEFVDEVKGISFINDSRSIRLTATRTSLECIKAPVVLILGGNDQENDYSVIFRQVKDKVKAIVYLGADSDKILTHYSRHSMLFVMAENVKEAVQVSAAYARTGDVVLFSPACPAADYKNRGNEFREEVKNLIK